MMISKDNLKNIMENFNNNIITRTSNLDTNITDKMKVGYYKKNTNIPYNFSYSTTTSIGNTIYLLGSGYYTISGSKITFKYSKYNYKYDTITDTYTKNTNIPYGFLFGNIISHGTDIYLLGGNNSAKYNYKYDTITDTYTKMTDIPYDFYGGSITTIDSTIYLFGSGYYNKGYSYGNYTYKYDILTDTYTKLTDIPYVYTRGTTINDDSNIYLFGSYYYSDNQEFSYTKYAYKYNIENDSYSKITDLPYDLFGGDGISVNGYIYLFGDYYDSSEITPYAKYLYQYDIKNDKYNRLLDIPYEFCNGNVVNIDNKIYLLGGSKSLNYNYMYTLPYLTNCIIKRKNHSIYTTNGKEFTFADASIATIDDDYYTEYNGNYIIKNTYPISSDGTTKMYIKSGAILNGKEISVSKEGWQDINILEYM